MSQIAIENCFNKIGNHFQLVVIASHRARQISSGSPSKLDRGNDKNPILALREISEGIISIDDVFKSLVQSYRFNIYVDDKDEDLDFILNEDQNII
jgi:DNA-directed RNA polymerase subunit omega